MRPAALQAACGVLTLLMALPAMAQTPVTGGSSSEEPIGNATMGALLQRGFEIKASSPSGNKFVVFLQKDAQAYACEFVTLTNSRCGAIDQ